MSDQSLPTLSQTQFTPQTQPLNPSTSPQLTQTNTTEEPFMLTPDQLLELQFARLKAAKLQQKALTEEELIEYKGLDYDPQRERAVLSTGFAGIAATVMGVASFAGWQMSNRYFVEKEEEKLKQGLFYRLGKFFKPHKMVQELEDKRLAAENAQKIAQLEYDARKAGIDLKNIPNTSQTGKILVQELPRQPIGINNNTTTTNQTTPPQQSTTTTTTSSYAKFQRKIGSDGIEPSLRPAYELKQQKLLKNGGKQRGRKYTSIAAIPQAMKSAAKSRAGIAFIAATCGLSIGSYFLTKSILHYFNINSYRQYTEWMSNEDATYRPADLAHFTTQLSTNLQHWLLKTPAKHLMEMMSTELRKEQPVTMADMQILDQASMASAYFVGYEFDLYNRLLGKPSRALNPTFDEYVTTFQQPIPLTQEEYQEEQLRLLRQLAGIPTTTIQSNTTTTSTIVQKPLHDV